MTLLKNLSQKSIPWFKLGLSGIFLFSLALRFWGLDRFNTLVFDEVYYAKFANDYLTNTSFFNAHPPLSQYIIAIGIWIGSHLPFGQNSVNGLTGSLLSPWDYRWINALTGSFIPLVVAALAYQLTRRRSYAFIAALFSACDALFLVESRYALNNIYLVLFGLLGQLFFLKALAVQQPKKRWIYLIIAGVWFGASIAIKWNGLWFLLGAYLLLGFAWGMRLITKQSESPLNHPLQSPLQNLTTLNLVQIGVSLAVIPVVIYSLAWIPHLQLNPTPNFWQMQQEILGYHQRIKSGPDVHPYCSTWYSWPLMIRPIVYFYKKAKIDGEIDPVLPSFPAGMTEAIYDVHAMGNPFLWWFSTFAILLGVGILIHRFLVWLETQKVASAEGLEQSYPVRFPPTPELWLVLYLAMNWLANLLPWARVTRCIFLYHYMGSSVFSLLALAWWVDRWIHSPQRHLRGRGVTIIFLILLAFVFWMPVYLGLPLSAWGWKVRMWLSSWI